MGPESRIAKPRRKAISGPQRPQPFYVLAETPCPYLMGRWERKLLTEISGPEATTRYSLLSRAGFRRSHHFAYRPACEGCGCCVPVRVVAGAFQASRSFKRIWRRNRHLSAGLKPARATLEQYAVFKRYISSRHGDGEMAGMTFNDYRSMLENTYLDSRVVEFRDTEGTLVAGCLFDVLEDGLSAVYSFFEPGLSQDGLGNYMVLWLIGEAQRRALPYVYLGYWIRKSPKMSYKSRFQPLQVLSSGGWRVMEA